MALNGLLGGLLVFLVGCLVLAVVIYVVKLIADMLTLPPQIKQIGLLIFGLICFIALLLLVFKAMQSGVILSS